MKKIILIVAVTVFTSMSILPQSSLAAEKDHDHAHEQEEPTAKKDTHDHGEEGHNEENIQIEPEQMSVSGINIITIGKGNLSHQVSVPGRITTDADRMAQIVPKVSGVVTEAHKNLGDKVTKGEVLALIESREMAEAAAEYQAAQRSSELAKTTYNREKLLWNKKVTAEQDYLSAKNLWQEAQIRLDLAKQKMQTLGGANRKSSRYHELQSPIDGVVVERELTLGEFVDTSHKAFTVADLSVLWVETAISPNDLSKIKEGQTAIVMANGHEADGKLIFISPVINAETRSAKVIIELENSEGSWRSGDYVTASIITDTQNADLVIPQSSVQTIDGKPIAFVKTEEGFEKRQITIGKKDGQNVQVTSGLHTGEEVAAGNTFVLKAETGKSEAEHSH